MRFALAAIASLLAPSLAQQAVPPDACATPQRALFLLRRAQRSGVVEYLQTASQCRTAPVGAQSFSDTPELDDHVLARSLDALVRFDPRYRWDNDEGVVVFRPAEYWSDAHQWLNQRMPTFSF